MRRRTFIGIASSLALGATAGCNADGVEAIAVPQSPAATAPFSLVGTSTYDQILLPNGRELTLDSSTRALTILDAQGDVVRNVTTGHNSALFGPVAAVAWGGEIAVVDKSRGVIVMLDADGDLIDELGTAAPLAGPNDAIVLEDGRLLVSDTRGQALVIFERNGAQSDFLRVSPDGTGAFNGPAGLAEAPNGDIHVVDGGGQRVVVITASGAVVDTYGAEAMRNPFAITMDSSGVAYVADPGAGVVFAFRDGREVSQWGTLDSQGFPIAPVSSQVRADGTLNIRLTRPQAA